MPSTVRLERRAGGLQRREIADSGTVRPSLALEPQHRGVAGLVHRLHLAELAGGPLAHVPGRERSARALGFLRPSQWRPGPGSSGHARPRRARRRRIRCHLLERNDVCPGRAGTRFQNPGLPLPRAVVDSESGQWPLGSANSAAMSIPTILDCDPGHDDMVAILLAAADPIDLLAITTVAGNGTLERTSYNARRLHHGGHPPRGDRRRRRRAARRGNPCAPPRTCTATRASRAPSCRRRTSSWRPSTP